MILGKGGQGLVYSHGKNKAVKRLPKNLFSNKEIYITKHLQNIDGVSKLYDIIEDDSCYYMIMKRYEEYEKKDIKSYYKRLLEVVSNIHEYDVIHNDIKPYNIMSDEGDLILIDYGSSLFATSTDNVFSYSTPIYSSIESLSSKMCLKSDMWSIGVMMYYDLTGTYPYDGYSVFEIFRQIQTKSINFDIIKDITAKDLIKSLLDKDLIKRLDAKQALNHDYFKNSIFKNM